MGSSFAVLRVQLSLSCVHCTAKATELSDSVFLDRRKGLKRKTEERERTKREGGGEPSSSVLSLVRIPRASLARLVSGIHRTHAQCSSLTPPSSAAVLCSSRRCSQPGALSLSSQRRGRRRLPQVLLLSLLGFIAAAYSVRASVDAPEPAPEQQECLFVMTAGNAAFVRRRADAGRLRQRQRTRTFTLRTFGCHASSLLALL